MKVTVNIILFFSFKTTELRPLVINTDNVDN